MGVGVGEKGGRMKISPSSLTAVRIRVLMNEKTRKLRMRARMATRTASLTTCGHRSDRRMG
jgi:hypothetical protein